MPLYFMEERKMDSIQFTQEEKDLFLFLLGYGIGGYLKDCKDTISAEKYKGIVDVVSNISNKVMVAVGGEPRY